MVLDRALGEVMMGFVDRHLLSGDRPPREHGAMLMRWGAVSLGAWLAAILLGAFLFMPPKRPPMPDIGPAMKGPPVRLAEGDRARTRSGSQLLLPLFAISVVAIVFWGGFSSLMMGAGLFECCAGVPFASINGWFDQLAWPKKIVAFPVLLALMVLIFGMPFVILTVAGELMGL